MVNDLVDDQIALFPLELDGRLHRLARGESQDFGQLPDDLASAPVPGRGGVGPGR